MGHVNIIGIDLAKRSFQVHGARADGSVAFRMKLSRDRLLGFRGDSPPFCKRRYRCALRPCSALRA